MERIQSAISGSLPAAPYDGVAVGVIDFAKKKFESVRVPDEKIYFDLASVTKPLTNSLSYFLKPEAFDEKMLLCLSHRGSLPAWGLLPNVGWQKLIEGYEVKSAGSLYSDFSALRVMLELKKKGIDQKKLCSEVWDKEMVNWKDLPENAHCLQTGVRNGEPNLAVVHDPNAYVINDFTSHAGLFSTIDGICRTLLNYEAKTGFIEKVHADLKKHSHRFSFGWDRVVDTANTLAGKGCGSYTFGHLGFTGTSVWIDPEKMRGHVILTNAVKWHWYDKAMLNDMRRAIGEIVWTMSPA